MPVSDETRRLAAQVKVRGQQSALPEIMTGPEVFGESALEGLTLGYRPAKVDEVSARRHKLARFGGQMAGGLAPIIPMTMAAGPVGTATGIGRTAALIAMGAGLGLSRNAPTDEERIKNALVEAGLFTVFEAAPEIARTVAPNAARVVKAAEKRPTLTKQVASPVQSKLALRLGEVGTIGAGSLGIEKAAGKEDMDALMASGTMMAMHGIMSSVGDLKPTRSVKTQTTQTQPDPGAVSAPSTKFERAMAIMREMEGRPERPLASLAARERLVEARTNPKRPLEQLARTERQLKGEPEPEVVRSRQMAEDLAWEMGERTPRQAEMIDALMEQGATRAEAEAVVRQRARNQADVEAGLESGYGDIEAALERNAQAEALMNQPQQPRALPAGRREQVAARMAGEEIPGTGVPISPSVAPEARPLLPENAGPTRAPGRVTGTRRTTSKAGTPIPSTIRGERTIVTPEPRRAPVVEENPYASGKPGQRLEIGEKMAGGTPEARAKSAVERVVKVMDKVESEARERINKRGTQMSLFSNPAPAVADLVDYAIIGAAKMARGFVGNRWVAAMIDDVGPGIKRHLDKIRPMSERIRKGYEDAEMKGTRYDPYQDFGPGMGKPAEVTNLSVSERMVQVEKSIDHLNKNSKNYQREFNTKIDQIFGIKRSLKHDRVKTEKQKARREKEETAFIEAHKRWAEQNPEEAAFVSPPTKEDLRGGQLFLSKDGNSGGVLWKEKIWDDATWEQKYKPEIDRYEQALKDLKKKKRTPELEEQFGPKKFRNKNEPLTYYESRFKKKIEELKQQAHDEGVIDLDYAGMLFNNKPGGSQPGMGGIILFRMIRAGARRADCYDDFLPEFYAQFGFKVVERSDWIPEYAPETWNYTKYPEGLPYVRIEYQGGPVGTLHERLGRFEYSPDVVPRRGEGGAKSPYIGKEPAGETPQAGVARTNKRTAGRDVGEAPGDVLIPEGKYGKQVAKSVGRVKEGLRKAEKKVPDRIEQLGKIEADRERLAIGTAELTHGPSTNYKEWAAAMEKKLGPKVRPQLKELYKQAKKNQREIEKAQKKRGGVVSLDDVREYVKAGKDSGEWYNLRDWAQKIAGDDWHLFLNFLAATSPKKEVTDNLVLALEALDAYRTRSKFNPEGSMDNHRYAVDLILQGADPREWTGPKTGAFNRNVHGRSEDVTVDTHMFKIFNLGKIEKDGSAGSIDSHLRYIQEVTRMLAEEQGVTPGALQAMMWVGRRLKEGVSMSEDTFPQAARKLFGNRGEPDLFGERSVKAGTVDRLAKLRKSTTAIDDVLKNIGKDAKEAGVTNDIALDMFGGSRFEKVLPDLSKVGDQLIKNSSKAWKSLDATIRKELMGLKVGMKQFGKKMSDYVRGKWDGMSDALKSALRRAHEWLKEKSTVYDDIATYIKAESEGAGIVAGKQGEAAVKARRAERAAAKEEKVMSQDQYEQLQRELGRAGVAKGEFEAYVKEEYGISDPKALSLKEARWAKNAIAGKGPMLPAIKRIHDTVVTAGVTHQELKANVRMRFGVKSHRNLKPEDVPLYKMMAEEVLEAQKNRQLAPHLVVEEAKTASQQMKEAPKKFTKAMADWYRRTVLEPRRTLRKESAQAAKDVAKVEAAERFARELKKAMRNRWYSSAQNWTTRERRWAVENGKAYIESGGKMQLPSWMSKAKAEEMRKAAEEVFEISKKAAKELDVKGFEEVEGIYFPHWMTPEARQAVGLGEGELFQAIKAEAKVKGGWDADTEAMWIQNIRENKFGSWENPRTADLPEFVTVKGRKIRVLETDPFKVVEAFIDRSANRAGWIKEFGQGEAAQRYMIAANKQVYREAGAAVAKIHEDVLNLGQGLSANGPMTGGKKIAYGAQNIARAAQLSGATPTNAFLGVVPSSVLYGTRRTMKNYAEFLSSPRGVKEMERFIGAQDNAMRQMADTMDFSGAIGEGSSKVLKALGFEWINRVLNATSAKSAMEYFGEAVSRGDRKVLMELVEKGYRFTEKEIDDILRAGKLNENQMRAIADHARSLTNFTEMGVLDRPTWMHKDFAKFFFAYMSPIFKLSDHLADTFDLAFRQRKPARLIKLIVGGTAAAGVNRQVKDWIRMKEREDETFPQKLYLAFLQSGSFGMLGEGWQRLYYLKKYDSPIVDIPMVEFYSDLYTKYPDVISAVRKNAPALDAAMQRVGVER